MAGTRDSSMVKEKNIDWQNNMKWLGHFILRVCVRLCTYVCVYVCVYVCARARIHTMYCDFNIKCKDGCLSFLFCV